MGGHSTVLVQTAGLNIITDPIWSERATPFSFIGPKRVREPGIRFDDLPKIDLVQIGRAHVELQSLMRISYAVFCLKKKKTYKSIPDLALFNHILLLTSR